MEVRVNAHQEDGKGIIKIQGVLDIMTIDSFLNQIDPLNEDELTSLTIDFSQMEFIDSTGVGAIMELIYLSQEKKFSIHMEGMNKQTHQIFEILGIFTILEALNKERV